MSVYLLSSAVTVLLLAFSRYSLQQQTFQGGKSIYHNNNQGLHTGNFVSEDKKRLSVTPIHTSRVKKASECLLNCLNNIKCISYNFEKNEEGGFHLCELLNTDKYNSPESFKDETEFQHYTPDTQCDTAPCLNEGKCIPNYESDGYTCNCLPINYGEHCEKLKVTVNITCDDKCDLYTKGKLLGHKPHGWGSSTSFILPLGTSNLAVRVENTGGPIKFLASLSNGKVTDSSWRCSSSTADGWSSKDFDASIWSSAVVYGGNGLQGISSEAKWIGVQNYNAASFYCVLKF